MFWLTLDSLEGGASLMWGIRGNGGTMPEGRIKIVFEPTDEEGMYRAVCIEDDKGTVLEGAWQDTRPWRNEHLVQVIWANDAEAQKAGFHRIMVGGQDVSEVLESRDS
jgi:hypothetical protein